MLSNQEQLDKALRLLGGHLELRKGAPLSLVICGGAALLARRILQRATQDVDVLALLDEEGCLVSPVPLPEDLVHAASLVARMLDLPPDWLNNEPSRGENGLFQMGLPDGIERRMIRRDYGKLLHVFFVERLDLIHFKLFAAAMAGGRHTDDLLALNPREEELEQAARWVLAHATPTGLPDALKGLLRNLGYEGIAERI